MKRWPIIRHVRYFIMLRRVNQHYELWRGLGMLPINRHLDEAVLDAIWRGEG
jgi:hypothetical protein